VVDAKLPSIPSWWGWVESEHLCRQALWAWRTKKLLMCSGTRAHPTGDFSCSAGEGGVGADFS